MINQRFSAFTDHLFFYHLRYPKLLSVNKVAYRSILLIVILLAGEEISSPLS